MQATDLGCKHIIPYINWGRASSESDYCWIYTEYAPYGSLEDVFKQEKLNADG